MQSTEDILVRLAETLIYYLEGQSITRRKHVEEALVAYDEWRVAKDTVAREIAPTSNWNPEGWRKPS